jgi:hypothetical protein
LKSLTTTLIFLFLTMPTAGSALDLSAGLELAAGKGSAATSTGSVETLTGSLGARAGATFRKSAFFAGLRSTYMQIEQISKVTNAVGNRRGMWFMPLAPLLGARIKRFQLFAEYEMMGDYKLARSTTNGDRVTYKKPQGFGLEVLYALDKKWHWSAGLRYQEVTFSQEQVGTTPPTDVSMNLSTIAGVVHASF